MGFSSVSEIDVRTIVPHERHRQIFGRLDALAPAAALCIVNDHDPVPLRLQLESRAPGQFQWDYLQAGPDLWRVQISKREAVAEPAATEDACCSGGACCG